MTYIDKKVDKIEDDIVNIKAHVACCRMKEQKSDHDKLIIVETNIDKLTSDHIDLKCDNKKEHKELDDKLDQVSGNLNQSMMYIKDMQKHNKLKVSMTTTIVSGVIATVIASIIIYFGTTVITSRNLSEPNSKLNSILVKISDQLNKNSDKIDKIEENIIEPESTD